MQVMTRRRPSVGCMMKRRVVDSALLFCGGLDAETFPYCGSRSGIHVRAGKRPAGPKSAEYRNRDGCYAGADNGARHYVTSDGHERPGDQDAEEEGCKDDPAAGDR